MGWVGGLLETATGPTPALVLAVVILVVALRIIRRLYQDLGLEREKRDTLHDRMESLLRETRQMIERHYRDQRDP